MHPQPVPNVPSFDEAKNRRQKVRAAGLNPNYWYPVAYPTDLAPGDLMEVKFWGKSFALFRTERGELRCILNRCAHRQLKLTTGEVRDCNVVCPYHGWSFDGEGRLTEIPHELFGKSMPKIQLPSYQVRERYGLVWLFPGDPERADKVPMPEIPELEGPDPWVCVPIDFVMNAHHSMIIDNVSDFTHEFLHRKYEPFKDPKLTGIEEAEGKVFVEYDTKVGAGKWYNKFISRSRADTSHMRLCYEYPHQWSNTDDFIKHWCFVLPIDERTTKTFFLFYYRELQFPLINVPIPKAVLRPVLKIANEILMRPLLNEDKVAVEAEQAGYEAHYDAPVAELNPAVRAFQNLTIERWEAYLAEKEREPSARRLPVVPSVGR